MAYLDPIGKRCLPTRPNSHEKLKALENERNFKLRVFRRIIDEKGNPITLESFYGKTKSQFKEEFRATI